MNKELFMKIDEFIESKGLILILLVLLLVLIPTVLSLGLTNEKLEEQIIERDNHIRLLQYRDSIASELLDYEQKDSTRVLVTRLKNGHTMTYKELGEERDSLKQRVDAYETILKKCKQMYPFDYKITYYKDSVITEMMYRESSH